MQNLKQKRIRRSKETRKRIALIGSVRLTVHRTNSHIYAQLIDDKKGNTIASASTLEEDMRKQLSTGSNITAAINVGKRIAEKALNIGVRNIAFDRSGYKYHGRIKALADAAREGGLKF